MDFMAEIGDFNSRFKGNSMRADRTGPALILSISGPLETALSIALQDVFFSALEKLRENDELIIDLAGVEYTSSTCVGAMTSVLLECKKKKVGFSLRNVHKTVAAVFDVLGLLSILCPDAANDNP